MAQNYTKYLGFIIPVSMLVTTLCIVVMFGWIYHIDILTTIFPDYASMKFNTALCLIFICVALIFAIPPAFKAYRVSQLFAILAFSLGALSFMQHLVNEDFKIDKLFFHHDEPSHFHVFHMSIHTSFCISCMGAALLWIKAEKRGYRKVCQSLLHVVTLIAFVVFVGYLYGVPSFHNLSISTSMALHTAISFLLLSVACSLLNPKLCITGIFTGNMLGNLMARRLFFPMLIGILFTGYLRILGHRYNILSVELGTAVLIVTFCIITLVLIWIVSGILNKAYKNIKRSKENLKMVVESAPYVLVMSDRNGHILEVNSKTERVFGYTADELVGQKVSMLVAEHFREEWMEKRSAFFSSPTIKHYGFDDEIPGLRRDGTIFPIEIVLTPIKTDEGLRILSFVSDITTRRANEAIIQKQLIELQSKNQELEQFNYISSHDLQEPLRTVLNYIQLLEEDYPELSNEIREHLKAMESSVTRMSTVVKSLLDFGRLGRNRRLVLTDCKTLINNVICDLNRMIKNSGAVIILGEGHPHIYAYETELRQLFQNLISNAIKFSKKDVVPRVEISCRKLDGFYEFAISDNGIGISPQYFDRIFDIFQRLNKEEEFEGHGIGLANCRKIAEMHGGKIWVESEEDKGSTFKFTILNFKP